MRQDQETPLAWYRRVTAEQRGRGRRIAAERRRPLGELLVEGTGRLARAMGLEGWLVPEGAPRMGG